MNDNDIDPVEQLLQIGTTVRRREPRRIEPDEMWAIVKACQRLIDERPDFVAAMDPELRHAFDQFRTYIIEPLTAWSSPHVH